MKMRCAAARARTTYCVFDCFVSEHCAAIGVDVGAPEKENPRMDAVSGTPPWIYASDQHALRTQATPECYDANVTRRAQSEVTPHRRCVHIVRSHNVSQRYTRPAPMVRTINVPRATSGDALL